MYIHKTNEGMCTTVVRCKSDTGYATSIRFNLNYNRMFQSTDLCQLIVGPVCMKTPHFPYILLPTQEVRVYFVAMITLRHALVRERSTYARSLYHVCDHITFSIHTTTARLYRAPVISAYGAGPPKVIGSWR